MPIFPAVVNGFARTCDGTSAPCSDCLLMSGTRYGSDFLCRDCAIDRRVAEQYATRKAVGR